MHCGSRTLLLPMGMEGRRASHRRRSSECRRWRQDRRGRRLKHRRHLREVAEANPSLSGARDLVVLLQSPFVRPLPQSLDVIGGEQQIVTRSNLPAQVFVRRDTRPDPEDVLTNRTPYGETLWRGLALLKRKRGFAVFTRHVHEFVRRLPHLASSGNQDCAGIAPSSKMHSVRRYTTANAIAEPATSTAPVRHTANSRIANGVATTSSSPASAPHFAQA